MMKSLALALVTLITVAPLAKAQDPSEVRAERWADVNLSIPADPISNVFFAEKDEDKIKAETTFASPIAEENPEWYVVHLSKGEKVKAKVVDGELRLTVQKVRPLWLRIIRLGL